MRRLITQLRAWLAVYRHRVWALLALHLAGWLVLGPAILLPGMPDDESLVLDQWVRAGVFALVRPADNLPVTYVDIDDELYRDVWGLPLVTPRDELALMLSGIAAAGAALIVVDIDLAWGELDPEFDRFLTEYRGPAPLVFVRRVEEFAAGLVVFGSPYDATFAANSTWLNWSHAYFYSDADGTLRDWLPWLNVCQADVPRALPSAAVLAVDRLGLAPASPPAATGCSPDAQPAPRTIVYTEDFGFMGDGRGRLEPGSPARTLRAAYLLDGTRIDAAALLGGRIAIVGGSHAAGQDLRQTPVGVLPGAVVQANTIMHAAPQLRAGDGVAWLERVSVAAILAVLALVTFPVAALLLAAVAVLLVAALAYFPIFESIELAALVFVQFRILAWLAEPVWRSWREHGWRIFLPEYFREKQKE